MAERTYEIAALHQVEVTYVVTGTDEEHARRKLLDRDIFTEYLGDPPTFGVNLYALERIGASVLTAYAYSDPSPTLPNDQWDIREIK